ncbi:MAG: tetratricopeptide repeat protein, partial [Anaerolineae bacterium]|nr:tetratricopeptide repeat protein [Anaerolineae bacterium]
MENFISKISKLVDQKDLPVILSALRQNNAIWEKLQNIEFSQHAIEYAGPNTEKWSPAAMALLAVGETADIGSLNAEDFNPAPSDLLPKAEEALKQFSDRPGSVSPNHTLEEAALVALALREKRRRSGSWKGLFDGLEIDDSLPWKTAFACLFSITPDPVESFYELANTTSAKAIPELFINAILSQPIHPDTQAEIIYEGIGRIQDRMQVDLVKTLDRQRPALAKTIAAQLITDRKIIHETSPELLDSFDDQLFQAVLHQVAGDFTEADHMLRLAWKTFEELQVDVTSKMALAAFHQKDPDFAVKTIDGISSLPGNSGTPVPAYLLAQLRAGNPKDLKSLTDAPVHPTDPHPIEFLVAAQSESDQGDQEKAKNAVLDGYERAIEIIDHEPASLLDHLPLLVEKLIEFELYPQAFNILGTLLEQSPTDPDLLVNMGLASCHNHLPHLAIQNAALAAALEPEAVDIRRGHAKMLSAARQWEAASVELEHIIRMQKDPSPNDLFMHVDCLIHAGSTDQAIRSAESLIEREPESGLAHTMLAEAQLLNGKQAEAQESFTKAIQSSPQLARPWLKRLSLLEESGKHLEALSVVEEALASVSNDLQLHAAGGRIHRTLDRKVDAVQSFSQAAQALSKQSFHLESGIEEDCISVYENLMAFGKFSLASEFIEKAVEIFPGHPGLIHAFARMQIENGELETALSHLKSLTALDAVDVEVLLDIARTNMETGDDLAHAKSTIETALNNDPDNPIGLVLKAHAENTNDSSMELIRVYKEAI